MRPLQTLVVACSNVLLGLLLVLSPSQTAHGGLEAGGFAPDQQFQGLWRGIVKVEGKDVAIIDIHGPGTYALFVEGQQTPFAHGKFEATENRYTNTPMVGASESGIYRFIDANTVVTTDKAGQEVTWKKLNVLGAIGNPAPAGAPVGTGNPARGPGPNPPTESGGNADAQASQPVAPEALNNFAAMRKATNAMAVQWNAQAQLFRVDTWGACSKSKFVPAGSRWFFCSAKDPKSALAIRCDDQTMKSEKYPLDPLHPPRPLPSDLLPPGAALARLWDLAPTVRPDQVYLQLLWPGVEKSGSFSGVAGYDSDPGVEFLKDFPVPLGDNESTAPKDTCVWRMLGVRDFDVIKDKAYGAYLYIDGRSGEVLSARRPAVGTQIYMRHAVLPASPIQPYVFDSKPIPATLPSEQVGTFDALTVGQKAESMDWGLRAMVRDGKSDAQIKAAIEQVDAWATRIEQVRSEDAQHGVADLKAAVANDPKNLAAQVALFRRYVDEIEKDKAVAQRSPKVITLQGLAKDRTDWLGREFDITPACLGTREQNHMVFDQHASQWLYKMEDPPGTGCSSKYVKPALQLLHAINATNQHDFELERAVTRLNWIMLGNVEAIGEEGSVSPIDPLQLMCLAEYSRVIGSEKMVQSAQLRAPKTWSNSSRRDLGDGRVEITTTTYSRPATAEEVAAANRLDAVINGQDRPGVAAEQDLAMKTPVLDWRPYFLWGRVEAVFYDLPRADRIIERGLMIDPGNAALHAARCVAWMTTPDANKAEVYCVDRFKTSYKASDLQEANKLSSLDPIAAYFMALQHLRLSPADIAAHASMCDVLNHFDGMKTKANTDFIERMPEAREQRQRELGVAALMEERFLDHPDQWARGVPPRMPATKETLIKLEVSLLQMRATDLSLLDRKNEATTVYRKILTLDPTNAAAQQALR